VSVYLIAFLAMLAAAIAVVGVSAFSVLRRALVLRRRSKGLQRHPTVIALRAARTLAEPLQGLPQRLSEISERVERIVDATTELIGTSAVLRLQVDRVGFATRLLLETFVPTLRGSMAD
jgi:hypothetical protein